MQQAGILTVTLNPAVDLSTSVEQVIAGPKLRCAQPRFDPGGGGVNVARAIRRLGGEAIALVAVAGTTGERLLSLLAAENLPALPVAVSGETRQNVAITDESTGAQYRFGLPGDILTTQDAELLLSTITAHLPPEGWVVLSGSLALGLPVDFPARIGAAMDGSGARLIVDTSKAALDQIITHPTVPLFLLRIDEAEAAKAAGHSIGNIAHCVDFATDLLACGVAKIIVIGLGAQGSVLVAQDHRLFCHAPAVTVRSKIGAGDAFVGAMTLAMACGDPLARALQLAAAAASATVETEGTALFQARRTHALLPACRVENI